MGIKVRFDFWQDPRSCSRNGCENVMCYKYSDIHGYICYDCFDELCDLGVNANIERFMNTKKCQQEPEQQKPADYFCTIFVSKGA